MLTQRSCSSIDNLNKGASTQCLRKCLSPHQILSASLRDFAENMNLALGYAEFEGIPTM